MYRLPPTKVGSWLIQANTMYPKWTPMDTAKLFLSGRSQAVRLPKQYRFPGNEVAVKHFGNGVLLLPIDDPWPMLEAGLQAFEPGFVLSRDQPEPQVRDAIDP